ncbi:MBL fold metallo-hydrolase [Candidatus Uhrbacteria bacterium]|nr:MBL fold metallo-hydrolase [Candidatus Uhrbacteria bacterium]
MHITWLGQACFKIEVKSQNEEVAIITYPFDAEKTGLKLPRTLTADLVLQAGPALAHPVETRAGKTPFIISGAGEYEVKGVFIYAIPLSEDPALKNPGHIFWIETEDMVLVHLGPLTQLPKGDELQEIEDLDILFVPTGGGESLDAKKAAELTAALEPRVVIPMLYKIPGLAGSIQGVEPFLKNLGEKSETLPKLKITRKDLPTDAMRVVVLEKA